MRLFGTRRPTFLGAAVLPIFLLLAGNSPVKAQSLAEVPVPRPTNLDRYVADEAAAIRLGKALFWDLQTGSDGMTACASCHFHAGTDNRLINTVSPGGDNQFDSAAAPNAALTLSDFPFHQTVDRHDRGSGGINPADPAVLRSIDDRVGAQGVQQVQLNSLFEGQSKESGRALRDPLFSLNARNVNQVTGRNTPTVINAVFNFANFWDGRANNLFNGVDPFGPQNVDARVWVNSGGNLAPLSLVDPNIPINQLEDSSLASQAVGPPLSDVEMSWRGRSFPEVGRKLLSLRPLAKQIVHPADGVLGPLSLSPEAGLDTTYAAMIQAAFQPEFWNGPGTVQGFTQMEINFSLFFGLAVQAYEATLVSDQTPFDRFSEGDISAMSASAQRGLSLFLSGGVGCFNCHIGAEFTGASISLARNPEEPGVIETMNMGNGLPATYDIGFYNIGVTPSDADPGKGGLDPFGNPLSFSTQRGIVNGNLPGSLTFSDAFVPDQGCVPDLLADPPLICPPDLSVITRVAAMGAFKTPTLRNVELTGPYFHNGGAVTLMQVVDFYIRGGNFREANMADLDPVIIDINGLKGDGQEEDRRALVDFLLALTDERVRWEMAPFDHPQFFVKDGHLEQISGNPKRSRLLADNLREIPAVGAAGRQAQGLPPLKPYLADELNGTALTEFHYQP